MVQVEKLIHKYCYEGLQVKLGTFLPCTRYHTNKRRDTQFIPGSGEDTLRVVQPNINSKGCPPCLACPPDVWGEIVESDQHGPHAVLVITGKWLHTICHKPQQEVPGVLPEVRVLLHHSVIDGAILEITVVTVLVNTLGMVIHLTQHRERTVAADESMARGASRG